ncbi:MAG: tRNA (guanosine(46)-N7)-methyltransferase TrmB [Cytophagaceae bacterium]
MGRNKLQRFEHNAQCHNVIEPGKEIFNSIKGKWHEYFGNNNPIVLEIGCGRGEYTTGLAAVYPDKNFIGIDIKGARIWKGSTVAIENNLDNVAFLRIRIYQLLDFFDDGEVNEIWITFPDPRPKEGEEKHRLTYPANIEKYLKILGGKGKLHLKTDSSLLFDYTLEVLKSEFKHKMKDLIFTKDLYNSPLLAQHFGIQTTYERMFMKVGFKINYLIAEFD